MNGRLANLGLMMIDDATDNGQIDIQALPGTSDSELLAHIAGVSFRIKLLIAAVPQHSLGLIVLVSGIRHSNFIEVEAAGAAAGVLGVHPN